MSEIKSKLKGLKKDELKIVANKLNLKGLSKQNKNELIDNIIKSKKEKEIRKALDINWWDKYHNDVYGMASVISLIIGIIFYFYPYSPPSVTDNSDYDLLNSDEAMKCYDSITISEIEKFYKYLDSKKLFSLVKPSAYSKNPDIKYEGKLIKDSNGNISGEMKFSHKESPNIFTLKNDGSIYPSDGDTNTVNSMEFIWISGNCYIMGCDDKDCGEFEKTKHTECVNGFWIGKYEVTQGQWKKIMGSNSSSSDENKPVVNITWNETQEFIRLLNEQNQDKSKIFRLPTEAEWEYACKSKEKLKINIHNMTDSVWEWCQDIYNEGKNKVIRGGECYSQNTRCASRENQHPDNRSICTGFRLICAP